MFKGTRKTTAIVGLILVGLSGLFYIALEVTTPMEQAQTPGEKTLGLQRWAWRSEFSCCCVRRVRRSVF
jgi:hypothetical protein